MPDLRELEKKIGYDFKNKLLLTIATTHKSYSHDKKNATLDSYNERLEFLGDAVLEQAISIYLYSYTPLLREGIMSKKRAEIVCEDSLYDAMRKAGLDRYILVGKCEKKAGTNNKAIIADMAEAIIGAIYLDGGTDSATKFVFNLLKENIDQVILTDERDTDFKTKLQELLQSKGNVKIEYVLDKEQGQAHEKIFYTSVYYNGEKIGEGCGKTKKASEQKAAEQGIKKTQSKD